MQLFFHSRAGHTAASTEGVEPENVPGPDPVYNQHKMDKAMFFRSHLVIMILRLLLVSASSAGLFLNSAAAEEQPYRPARVVYDLTAGDIKHINQLLDRASMLQNLYGSDPFEASIVIVIHDRAIPRFAKSNQSRLRELQARAQNLMMSEVIEYRLCRASAKLQGYKDDDFPGYIKIVPMADAEIIKLQHEGYAYMR